MEKRPDVNGNLSKAILREASNKSVGINCGPARSTGTSNSSSEWITAVCTLLPSRRSQRTGPHIQWAPLPNNVARAVTLPRYQRDMRDQIAINLRRQLSSASHRKRHLPGSSNKSKKHSFSIFRKPGGIEVGGIDVPDYIDFEEGDADDDESISEERIQWEQLEAIRSMPAPMSIKREYRSGDQGAYVNPAYHNDVPDFKEKLPTMQVLPTRINNIYPEQTVIDPRRGRNFPNADAWTTSYPSRYDANQTGHQQGTNGTNNLFVEPDYDIGETAELPDNNPSSRVVYGRKQDKETRLDNNYERQQSAAHNQRKNVEKIDDGNIGRIFGYGQNYTDERPSAGNQHWEMNVPHTSAKSDSYPNRSNHSGSARNSIVDSKMPNKNEVDSEGLLPTSGWVSGLNEELENGGKNEIRRADSRKTHMTMKNAKEIARAIGMKLEDDGKQNEDGQRTDTSSDSETNVQFAHVKRKCWSRQCWSKSSHSHIQRFLQSDGMSANSQTKLQQTPVSPATGFVAWELKHQKARKRIFDYWKEMKNQAHFWSKSMKTIEGQYGTGVVSYFIFLRWLLYLNLLILLTVFVLIVLPQACYTPVEKSNASLTTIPNPTLHTTASYRLKSISTSPLYKEDPSLTDGYVNVNEKCENQYEKCVQYRTDPQVLSRLQDFLQGTGWMERTLLFSGEYTYNSNGFCNLGEDYRLSLAYILVTLSYFVICLAMMVVYTTQGVRETMMTSEGHLTRYCNLVFGGWDYCIEGKANAQRKHDSIMQEVKSNLAEERRRAEVEQWSNLKKSVIYLTRVLVNGAVLLGLCAAGGLIYWVCKSSLDITKKKTHEPKKTDASELFNEFRPSLTLTGLNIVLPALFTQICKLENYSVGFEVKITLIRTVFLRLASVGVLVVTLYFQVKDTERQTCNGCENILCWETYVGQQMYKLVILDFIVTCVIVLLIELPRMLIVKHCTCKLSQFIGRQEFDIPKHVLDLVYSQTLCWIGTFYSPLLPAVCVLKYIFFFYLKKFTLLVNCVPSEIPYRASRSNTFFMIVLMLSFLLASIPLWYSVANEPPSRACGPFRIYETMWDPVTQTVKSWPEVLQELFKFLTSVGFAAPVLIILCLAIYYYSTVWAANKKMISVLREQLVIEGTDKQFLLARLAEVARRRHKAVEL